ncbi:MAG TPA: MBL fold metallo-hydrolase [Acidimicrobiales bacterium]|nr:MBL fold metallo-hydrolase [Acidimicrobiales bacterium]
MAADLQVHRIDFGYFVRPAAETATSTARVEPCLGYMVAHPGGVLLVDTGMGSHPDVDAHCRPRRIGLDAALAAAGARLGDVRQVVNCHLHFDHCGGNPQLAGRPIFVQRGELEAARQPDYTLPDLIDAPGTNYEVLDGCAEVLEGIHVVPTPGHTAGRQSVVVRQSDGTIVVAGQSHDTATQFGTDILAARAVRDRHSNGDVYVSREWVERLLAFDPRRVVFAHDQAVWEP